MSSIEKTNRWLMRLLVAEVWLGLAVLVLGMVARIAFGQRATGWLLAVVVAVLPLTYVANAAGAIASLRLLARIGDERSPSPT